jgi:hypothetical protein
MNRNYIHSRELGGNELIKQLTIKNKTYSTQTTKQTNNTTHKTHTSATLTSNIFPDQPSITASVQLCYNVLCWVKLMNVRKNSDKTFNGSKILCRLLHCVDKLHNPKTN